MPEFLELLSSEQALAIWMTHLPDRRMDGEELETSRARGRVTSCAVLSPEALPAFSRSTVDGYAVKANDTYGCSDALPAYLEMTGEILMGRQPTKTLQPGQAVLIHTGGMLPDGADAVVMVEHTQVAHQGEIEVLRAVAVGENVLLAGEDVTAGQEVISAGKVLRPAEIGGLLALGISKVTVARKPRVGILSSGDEVIPPDQMPLPGQVRDVNSYTLSALVEDSGGDPRRYGILPDNRDALRDCLRNAVAECDLVVITAGSSASTRDLTAEVIDEMGPPGVLVHGVNIKPGKPTILAVCKGKPVIGLPGNPVSALVIARLFVTPIVAWLVGLPLRSLRPAVLARLTVNIPSQAGREDWVPVKLAVGSKGTLAEPVFYKSNLIFTLVQADGMVYIPPDATGLEVGSEVSVYLI